MSFEKKYDPSKKEQEIRVFWDKNDIYKFDKNTTKPIYSIDTPPPTMSGKMHIGHAFSFSQQDFIARYKRMSGFEVFYPFGTDDNGLPTEKLVQKERKVNLRKIPRKDAIKIVLDYLEEKRDNFVLDWKNLGMSCDFELFYSTIDDYSRKISQETFIDLYNKGLIERREGPVMWDRVFQTSIAQAELEDLERDTFLNYVKAKVEGTESTYMIYATTRPELCFAVVGMSLEETGDYVKIKVKDEFWIVGKKSFEEKFSEFEVVENLKGTNLIGEKVIIPIVNKSVEISHDISVKADLGTGIAYFCTYGGIEDVEWASRHKVSPVELLDKTGRLNNLGKHYGGMLAEEARSKIIKELEEKKFLVKQEKKKQIVNVGERSGVEVEYLITKQWYLKYLDKKEYFFEKAQEFNWYPKHMKARLENWIKGLNWDYGFSRQRHFGVPIPVWYDENGEVVVAKKEELPVDPMQDSKAGLIGEEDVFDTWFTSASTPFLAINLLKEEKIYDKLFPLDLRPQAHDIINFWLFYTMAKTNLLVDKNPFKDILMSGWILDPKGKKMSKSKGNIIEPREIKEKHSYDALRYMAGGVKLGFDVPFQEKDVQTGGKVLNKLYNANKFASMLLEGFNKEDKEIVFKNYQSLKSIDKWVLAKCSLVSRNAKEGFEVYDYAKARHEFDLFFMRDVADNYIEIVKQRLWKPEIFGEEANKSARSTIYFVLYSSLRGFAPFMPFITEEIYQSFYKDFEDELSVHKTSYPEFVEEFFDEELLKLGDLFVDIVSTVRKLKSEKNLSMKAEIKELTIECDEKLEEFVKDSLDDLKAVTSSEKVVFKKSKDFKVSALF